MLFFDVFCCRTFPDSAEGFPFLQLKLGNSQTKAKTPYEMSVPKAFVANLFLYAMVLLNIKVRLKRLNINQGAENRTLARMTVLLAQEVGNALRNFCLL